MKKVDDYISDFWGVINYDLTDSSGRYLSRWDIRFVMERIQDDAYKQGFVDGEPTNKQFGSINIG